LAESGDASTPLSPAAAGFAGAGVKADSSNSLPRLAWTFFRAMTARDVDAGLDEPDAAAAEALPAGSAVDAADVPERAVSFPGVEGAPPPPAPPPAAPPAGGLSRALAGLLGLFPPLLGLQRPTACGLPFFGETLGKFTDPGAERVRTNFFGGLLEGLDAVRPFEAAVTPAPSR